MKQGKIKEIGAIIINLIGGFILKKIVDKVKKSGKK